MLFLSTVNSKRTIKKYELKFFISLTPKYIDMKRFLLLIALIATVGCKASNDPKKIDPKDLAAVVNVLASDSMNGRRAGSKGIDMAATYIEESFETLGVKPYFEGYRDNFRIDSLNAFNVVGILEGSDSKLKNEIIMIGAHYDHIGIGSSIKKFAGRLTDIDSLANGANDNASGTAMVLGLANHFAKAKSNRRTLIFALFAGEEFGLLGSKHLADRLKDEELNLYIMINFEMLGVPFTDGRDYDVFLTGYDLSNMAEKMNAYAGTKVIGQSEVAVKYQLFKRSDNYPFYEAFKIPAQSISSCDLTNYDFYHHADDEADKMDYEHMSSVLNKLIPAIETISNSETKIINLIDE